MQSHEATKKIDGHDHKIRRRDNTKSSHLSAQISRHPIIPIPWGQVGWVHGTLQLHVSLTSRVCRPSRRLARRLEIVFLLVFLPTCPLTVLYPAQANFLPRRGGGGAGYGCVVIARTRMYVRWSKRRAGGG